MTDNTIKTNYFVIAFGAMAGLLMSLVLFAFLYAFGFLIMAGLHDTSTVLTVFGFIVGGIGACGIIMSPVIGIKFGLHFSKTIHGPCLYCNEDITVMLRNDYTQCPTCLKQFKITTNGNFLRVNSG